jgi:outer membrane murein-binding lipoprotein Lpp
MKKNIMLLTTSVILSSLLLSGCGSSADSDRVEESAYELSAPAIHDEIKSSRDVDANNQIDIYENADQIVLEMFGHDRHNIFYINSDNNNNTGHLGSHGSDYIIEDGRLYEYQGPGWNWSFVGNIDFRVDGNSVNATLDKSNFRRLSSTISVVGRQFDSNWNTTHATNSFELNIEAINENVASNNININERGVNVVANFDNNILHFELSSESNPSKTNGIVFMDTDTDTSTGLQRYGLGSDYLLQNGALYRYTGRGTNWSWAYVGRYGSRGDHNFNVDINSNLLNNSTAINFVAKYYDSSWNRVDSTLIHSLIRATGNNGESIEEIQARLTALYTNEERLVVDEQISGNIYRVTSARVGIADSRSSYLVDVSTNERLDDITEADYEHVVETRLDLEHNRVSFVTFSVSREYNIIYTFDTRTGRMIEQSTESLLSDEEALDVIVNSDDRYSDATNIEIDYIGYSVFRFTYNPHGMHDFRTSLLFDVSRFGAIEMAYLTDTKYSYVIDTKVDDREAQFLIETIMNPDLDKVIVVYDLVNGEKLRETTVDNSMNTIP